MKRTSLLFAGLVLIASFAFGGDGHVRRSARPITGRYIVVLQPGADAGAVSNKARSLGKVRNTYERGVHGFSIEVSDADAQALAGDARVQFVEEDSTVAVASAPWGLDRIDQHALPLDGNYVSHGSGAGITVYVVDTGILASHADFGGRVAPGFNATGDANGTTDCNGHGTHVAGVVGGTTYGVAKSVTLVPVRVLGCDGSGSLSALLAGIDWILADQSNGPRPAVVNMSLGGDASTALDLAIRSLLCANMTTVVAAGNGNTNACTVSPARVPGAMTVGASTPSDQRASFSNYGSCVDLFAPGTGIISDWYSSPTATAISSGTSESAPFVAGVAALCLEKDPTASPATISQTIITQSTAQALSGAIGASSPNRLLFSVIDTLNYASNDAQLLADPSFDHGTTFWTSDICTVLQPTGCPPSDSINLASFPSRSGNGHAAIGGRASTFHLTSEAVTVPSNVSAVELSFYLWVVTKDPKSSADDLLNAEIRDASGALIETLGTFSNLDACSTYWQRTFDVSRYRGQTIRISFSGVQTQGPPTWFLLDDVDLNVWP